MDQQQYPTPLPSKFASLPEPEKARLLGIDLSHIDWSKVAALLQFLAGLLAKQPPTT